jgi:ATP synthase subunit 6
MTLSSFLQNVLIAIVIGGSLGFLIAEVQNHYDPLVSKTILCTEATLVKNDKLVTINLSPDVVKGPLEQFDILNLEPFSLGLPGLILTNTNAEIFLFFTFLVLSSIFINYIQMSSWIPSKTARLIYILELVFQELMILVFRNVGLLIGQVYFPCLVFIFLVLTALNLVGMVPYSFTITSHIIVTFTLSATLFVGINIRSIIDKQYTFFCLFLPTGAPDIISPFLVVIELISYIARVFSLAIRLFANMMAGHTLLKILIGFSFTIASQNINSNWPLLFVALVPFFIVYIITFLEVAIALLQGYVFTVLMCLYIKDLHVAH